MAKSLPGYVKDIRFRSVNDDPTDNISITLACEANLDEFRRILRELPLNVAVQMGADTTYGTGKHYSTIIYVRHPLIERKNPGHHQTDRVFTSMRGVFRRTISTISPKP